MNIWLRGWVKVGQVSKPGWVELVHIPFCVFFFNGNTFLFMAYNFSYPSVHSHAFHPKTGNKEREDENCNPSSPGIISSPLCFIICSVLCIVIYNVAFCVPYIVFVMYAMPLSIHMDSYLYFTVQLITTWFC